MTDKDDDYYKKRIEPKISPYSAPHGNINDQWQPFRLTGESHVRFFSLEKDLYNPLILLNNQSQYFREKCKVIKGVENRKCICGVTICEIHPIVNKYTDAFCWVGRCCIKKFKGCKLNQEYAKHADSHKRLLKTEKNNLEFMEKVNEKIRTEAISFEDAIRQVKNDDTDNKERDVEEYFKILKLPSSNHMNSMFIPDEAKTFFRHIEDTYETPYKKFKKYVRVNITDFNDLKKLVCIKQKLLEDNYLESIDTIDIHNIVLYSNNDDLKNSYMLHNNALSLVIPPKYCSNGITKEHILYGSSPSRYTDILPHDDTYFYTCDYHTLTWEKVGLKSNCVQCSNIYVNNPMKPTELCTGCYLITIKPNDFDKYYYVQNMIKARWDKVYLYLKCTVCQKKYAYDLNTVFTNNYCCKLCSIEKTLKYNTKQQTISFIPECTKFHNTSLKSYYTFQKVKAIFACIDCGDEVHKIVEVNWNIRKFCRCISCYKTNQISNKERSIDNRFTLVAPKNMVKKLDGQTSNITHNDSVTDITPYIDKWKSVKTKNGVFRIGKRMFFVNVFIKNSLHNIVELTSDIDIHDLGEILSYYENSHHLQAGLQNVYRKYFREFVDKNNNY